MPLFFEQHSSISDHSSTSNQSFITNHNAISNQNSKRYADSNSSSNNPSPSSPLPFFITLLISESFFPHDNSPAATIIVPFFKKDIPFAYWIIIAMELVTALLLKWCYGTSYSILSPNLNAALPDLTLMRQVYSFNSFRQRRQNPPVEESTPLLPLGMSFNISFSSPFTAPTSRTATLYTIQLKEIKKVPGYLVPLAALILYFILKPIFEKNGSKSPEP